MLSFIIKRQPKAYQGSKTFKSKTSRTNYETDLEVSLKKFNPVHNSYANQELYGLVYYFFTVNTGTDADNISKPIWDCLKGKLFSDDKQVKLRTAGSFDLTKNDFKILDFSGVKGEVIAELLDAFDNEEHIVYIECGLLDMKMYKFNLEANGN
jgi:Holliday junction resolvase RusA-like endonuclease